MTVFAILGAKALYLTYVWLLSAIAASWLSERKGYGSKPGLACGLILTVAGVIIWLLWPAKPASRWKVQGVIPRRGAKTVAETLAERGSPERSPDETPRR
jgi:hypothetical protein